MGGRGKGGGGNKSQQQQPAQQQRPSPQPQQQQAGPNLAQAQAENAAREAERQKQILDEENRKKEQARFEQVSKLEGEKRRKELEQKSAAAATTTTGGKEFAKPKEAAKSGSAAAPEAKPIGEQGIFKDQGRGQATISQGAIVEGVSPDTVQGTILGLPKNTRVFTKFGESINRAANLTYSSPNARVGGM